MRGFFIICLQKSRKIFIGSNGFLKLLIGKVSEKLFAENNFRKNIF